MPRTTTPKAPATNHPVLGRLPVGWKRVRLGAAVELIMGQSPPGNTYNTDGEGLPLINGPTEFTDRHPVKIQWTTTPTKTTRSSDILLCVRGSSTGRMNIADGEYCIGRGVCAIRGTEDTDTEFLSYLMQSVLAPMLRLSTGSTFANIDSKSIKSVYVLLPPLPEQRRIARILGTWDKAIGLLGQQISAKEERLRGLIDQLVSGKRHGAKGDKLPKGWRWKTLGELGSFTKGKGILKADISTEGVPAITYGELYTVHHVRIKRFYSFVNDGVADASQPIQYNDVLFAGSGETAEEIGKAAVYLGRERACAGGDVIILRPKDVNALYLATALNSSIADRQRLKFGQGHSVVHIYPSQLAELKVPLPPAEIQDFIASATTALDDELDLLRTKLAQLHEQKRGLMQRLLGGGKSSRQ